MSYITVMDTREKSEVFIIRNIFEQNNLDYRVLDEQTNDNFPIGTRIQVAENQQERAIALLRENGFLNEPGSQPERVSQSRFWIYLFLALLFVILVAVLINWFMDPR